jgi:DNA polymerase-1
VIDLSALTVIDTETPKIEAGILAPELVCFSSATKERGSERVYSKQDAVAVFRKALKGIVGGQNIAYDFGVLCKKDPSLIPEVFKALREGRVLDSMLLEALHAIGSGTLYRDPETNKPTKYPLDYLERRYLGIDRSADKHASEDGDEPWRLRYGELLHVPLNEWPQDALDYPKADARGTFDVLVQQLASDRLNTQCIAHETQAAFALHLTSVWGMRTDPVMVPEVVGEIKRIHEESRERLLSTGLVKTRKARGGQKPETPDFFRDNRGWKYATDKKALAVRVTAAFKGAPPLTDKGGVSTARDTLNISGDELLEDFAETGENEKLFSTYSTLLERGTRVPINARYQTIIASDRVSNFDPNLQQLPRKGRVRECFQPRPGTLYSSVDYASLELATVSQICLWWFKHSAMADAINSGQDLHTRLAARFADITYEEALVRRKNKDELIVGLRQAAKPVNFGLGGLMGAATLVFTARKEGVRFCELAGQSKKNECKKNDRVTEHKGRTIAPTCVRCLALAEKYRGLWYEEWPEMHDYHEICIAIAGECEQGIPAESMSQGKLLRLDTSPSAMSNHFFQNLAARGAKHALWKLSEECYTDTQSVLYGAFRPVVFVHDEVIAEIQERVAHEAAHRQAKVMIDAMQEHVPDIKIEAKPALMRRWFKAADTVYGKNGRLRPWWPTDALGGEWSWAPDQEAMALDRAA